MIHHRYIGPEINIFLNGNPPHLSNKEINVFNTKINYVVDGAYNYVKNNNIKIDYIIGDFDSINNKINIVADINNKYQLIKTLNQNYTDFDKTLNIIYRKGFLNINVWGASGKEPDHFLGNLSTALKYKQKLSIIFYDNHSLYFFSKKQETLFIQQNKTISLFPFTKVTNLFAYGLKYPIKKKHYKLGNK
ncbi:thiamine diphosphokinase [Blattabacterium cuenoti]|uniref:thiamine diphosphokinase n=1 Tax=Blattabacterium cuenoti TaxID=1653831 RepID=UPI001EEAF95C|nr:thiamine diphosphokinase [Blattabacterium cuenoti]